MKKGQQLFLNRPARDNFRRRRIPLWGTLAKTRAPPTLLAHHRGHATELLAQGTMANKLWPALSFRNTQRTEIVRSRSAPSTLSWISRGYDGTVRAYQNIRSPRGSLQSVASARGSIVSGRSAVHATDRRRRAPLQAPQLDQPARKAVSPRDQEWHFSARTAVLRFSPASHPNRGQSTFRKQVDNRTQAMTPGCCLRSRLEQNIHAFA